MKRITLLVLSLAFYNVVFSQTALCDQISKELETILKTFSRVDLETTKRKIDSINLLIPEGCEKSYGPINLIKGRYKSKKGQLDSALVYYVKANEFAIKSEETMLKKYVLHYMALVENEKSNSEKALMLQDSAYKIECNIDSARCKKFNIQLLINSAVTMKLMGKHQESIDRLIFAEKEMISQGIADSLYRLAILNTIGNIYDEGFSDLKESLNYYKKALLFMPKKHRSRFLIYNNIGSRYADLNQIDSAKVYFSKTIQEAKNPRYLIVPYQKLGSVELENKNYDKAKEYYSKSLKNATLSKSQINISYAQALLGKTLFLTKDYKEAKGLIDKAQKEFAKEDYSEDMRVSTARYKHLLKVASKDPSTSMELYDYFEKLDSLNDKGKLEVLEKALSRHEKLLLRDSLGREVLLKENEEQKVKNYRLSTLALILGLLLVGGLAYQFRTLFTGQKIKNEELVFKNKELESLNQRLKEKSTAIATITPNSIVASKIQFRSADKTYILEPGQIKYVQAESDGTRVFYEDQNRWTDLTLKQLKGQFSEDAFIQVFRSTIVNLQHVGWINTTTLEMKDGTNLKIGRTYKPRIVEALATGSK